MASLANLIVKKRKSISSSLVSHGEYKESLLLYARKLLLASSFVPDCFTFPFLLKSCAKLQSAPLAQQIHGHVVKFGFQADIYAATALTGTYMKLELFQDAFKVFEKIPHPTLPSYNAIISGFAQCGRFEELLHAFRQLMSGGLCPNSVTIASMLPVCGRVELGLQLHGYSIKMGHDMDDYVATALITMYSNCAELVFAQRVFELILDKKVVSYNAMISGFLRNTSLYMAVDLFRKMMISLRPNSTTFITVLSVCSEISALPLGEQIHCRILKCEVSYDIKIGTALIDMYCKCDSLEHAHKVFTRMENRNIVTWNSMISGLLSNGCVNNAADMLQQMRLEGLSPDKATYNAMICGYSRNGNVTEAFRLFMLMMHLEGIAYPSLECLTSLLQACSSISELVRGKEIHGHVIRTRGDHEDDEVLQTTLIHMYMKCGCPVDARKVFDRVETESSDPALWNAMISGYARNGEIGEALDLLRKMQEKRVTPNPATFLACLSACNYTGQVEAGMEISKMMTTKYGISPTAKHLNCMVNLLGRAGKLAEAWDLLGEIPDPPPAGLYFSTLLGASGCYADDVEFGEKLAEGLSQLEPGGSSAPLVILSNIYAGQGRWNEVERLRNMITRGKLIKMPGCSWIGAKQLLLT